SELEARFLSFVATTGLPSQEVNAWLQVRGHWIECDSVWRPQRLVVELDGHAVHGTAAAFERGRARDRRLHPPVGGSFVSRGVSCDQRRWRWLTIFGQSS